MDVPEVAGLNGAWLEPAGSPAAARRIAFSGTGESTDVWAHPFRIACGVTTTGRVVASGAALEVPLAAWRIEGGAGTVAAASWAVDFRRAWPEPGPAGAAVASLSQDGTRLLVATPDSEALALFATLGGRLTVDDGPPLRVRCSGAGAMTLVAIGASDRADLDRTLDLLARRGLAGLARQRLQHDEQVARGGAALSTPLDPAHAVRFEAAKRAADAELVELPGIGRAPMARLYRDRHPRPGVIFTAHACRTAVGLLAAGLREPARDTLRFLARVGARAGTVPAEVSAAGHARGGGPADRAAFGHLAARYWAWTADAVLREELAAVLRRGGRDVSLASGARDETGAASPGDVLRAAIEDEWGIEPDAPAGCVRVSPRLPPDPGRSGLSRLRVGRSVLELRLRRAGPTLQLSMRKVIGPALIVDCGIPDVVAQAVELDGIPLGAQRARFEATGDHELILHAGA